MTDELFDDVCPDCGQTLPKVTITASTIPVEVVAICSHCPGADSKWAEHFEGDILRFPPIHIGEDSE